MSIKKGSIHRKIRVLDVVTLSTGEQILKTPGNKRPGDIRVKIVSPLHPIGFSIKHAHFAIDFYGKICEDKVEAMKILDAIVEVWKGVPVVHVLKSYANIALISGYSLEYILHALNWILDQEDTNFTGRPQKKQNEINALLRKFGYPLQHRLGSQLAIALLCDIADGTHPIEAFYKTNLRI